MKLIIAGSRTIFLTKTEMDSLFCIVFKEMDYPDEIVCGKARGIDTSGELFGKYVGAEIVYFPADWDKHGKAAGHIRNKEMAKYADALLLIWDGKSKGSANMYNEMNKLGKPVYEVVIRRNE